MSATPPPPPGGGPPRRGADEVFLGGVLIAAGVLVAVLSGACCLTVLGSGRGATGADGPLVLFFGAPFFLGGLACVVVGWTVGFRRRR